MDAISNDLFTAAPGRAAARLSGPGGGFDPA